MFPVQLLRNVPQFTVLNERFFNKKLVSPKGYLRVGFVTLTELCGMSVTPSAWDRRIVSHAKSDHESKMMQI